jgi:hypothetical protein
MCFGFQVSGSEFRVVRVEIGAWRFVWTLNFEFCFLPLGFEFLNF